MCILICLNPPEFLSCGRDLLKAGGELLIQTGDVAHFTANEMYRPMLLPDHLSFASEEILSNILKRSGFENISVIKYPVVPFKPIRGVKELVKLLHPGKVSMISCLLDPKYNTDMYIRAKLIR